MEADLYNPCKDGFVAKFWECLRRNKEFLDAANYFGAKTEDDALDAIQWIKQISEENPLYDIIFRHMFLSGEEQLQSRGEEAIPSLGTLSNWRQLHAKIRIYISDSLERFSAFSLDVPNLKEINPYPFHESELNKSKFSKDKCGSFFYDLEETLKTHRLIAFPNYVWDKEHEKQLMLEIKAILGKNMGSVNTLKPNGRSLGSNAEWRAFLLVENWERDGFTFKEACSLAAHEVYGKVDFGSDPDQRVSKAKTFTKKHSQLSKIESGCKRIRSCISSVYPNFKPVM